MTILNRRNFLRQLFVLCAGVAASSYAWSGLAQENGKEKRPNIMVIVADDLGYADVGCQGCKDIPTPNIDSLARHGVRFTQGYVCMPFCAPSRAGLMTGLYPQRFGFEDNPDPILDPKRGLPPGQVTIGDVMKEAGYVTGLVGKWHLGTAPAYHPNNRGFNEFFGFLGGAHFYLPYKGKKPKNPEPEWFINQNFPIMRQDKPVEESEYMTDAISREAVSFVTRHRSEPFFLYLAYSAPHSPYEATEQYLKNFPDIKDPNRRLYAAMTDAMDQGIGKVLQALRDNKLEENTLVFFLSDNGGGAPPHYPSFNTPLRGFKGQHYEGGIRVPFIAQWRGKLPEGRTYDQPVSSLDILPTAAALAGSRENAALKCDGVNLMPYLLGEKKSPPHERLFWRQGGGTDWAVREGNFKLMQKGASAPELYDIVSDISEVNNMAAAKPDVVKRMAEAYTEWSSKMIQPLWRSMK